MQLDSILNHKHFTQYLLIIGIVIFMNYCILYFPFTADDSYISFRYGYNLVHYGIWNYNPTNNPVEAYTNFSYAFLSIIPALLHIPVALFFKLFGLAILVALIVQLKRGCTNKSFLLGILFVLCNPSFFIHAFSGLETPLFVFLIFETIYLLSLGEMSTSNEKLFLIILISLPLTRPEGILFSILGFVLYRLKNKIKSFKFFCGITFFGAAYLLFRLIYFKDVFPISFYSKTLSSTSMNNLIAYIAGFKTMLILSAVLFIVINSRLFRSFLLLAILLVIFLYAPSDLQMNYANRFWFQLLTPVFLSSVLFVDNKRMELLLVIFVLTIFLTNPMENLFGPNKYAFNLNKCHKDLGIRLNHFKQFKYKMLVSDGGVLPYFSEWESYDILFGLNFKPAAKKELKLTDITAINPDLVFLVSNTNCPNNDSMNFANQKIVNEYMKYSENYEYISASKFQDEYYLLAFLKKDLEAFDRIKSELKANEYSSNKSNFTFKKILNFDKMLAYVN